MAAIGCSWGIGAQSCRGARTRREFGGDGSYSLGVLGVLALGVEEVGARREVGGDEVLLVVHVLHGSHREASTACAIPPATARGWGLAL